LLEQTNKKTRDKQKAMLKKSLNNKD